MNALSALTLKKISFHLLLSATLLSTSLGLGTKAYASLTTEKDYGSKEISSGSGVAVAADSVTSAGFSQRLSATSTVSSLDPEEQNSLHSTQQLPYSLNIITAKDSGSIDLPALLQIIASKQPDEDREEFDKFRGPLLAGIEDQARESLQSIFQGMINYQLDPQEVNAVLYHMQRIWQLSVDVASNSEASSSSQPESQIWVADSLTDTTISLAKEALQSINNISAKEEQKKEFSDFWAGLDVGLSQLQLVNRAFQNKIIMDLKETILNLSIKSLPKLFEGMKKGLQMSSSLLQANQPSQKHPLTDEEQSRATEVFVQSLKSLEGKVKKAIGMNKGFVATILEEILNFPTDKNSVLSTLSEDAPCAAEGSETSIQIYTKHEVFLKKTVQSYKENTSFNLNDYVGLSLIFSPLPALFKMSLAEQSVFYNYIKDLIPKDYYNLRFTATAIEALASLQGEVRNEIIPYLLRNSETLGLETMDPEQLAKIIKSLAKRSLQEREDFITLLQTPNEKLFTRDEGLNRVKVISALAKYTPEDWTYITVNAERLFTPAMNGWGRIMVINGVLSLPEEEREELLTYFHTGIERHARQDMQEDIRGEIMNILAPFDRPERNNFIHFLQRHGEIFFIQEVGISDLSMMLRSLASSSDEARQTLIPFIQQEGQIFFNPELPAERASMINVFAPIPPKVRTLIVQHAELLLPTDRCMYMKPDVIQKLGTFSEENLHDYIAFLQQHHETLFPNIAIPIILGSDSMIPIIRGSDRSIMLPFLVGLSSQERQLLSQKLTNLFPGDINCYQRLKILKQHFPQE